MTDSQRGTNPLSRSLYGFNAYLRGVSWLWSHKGYLLLCFIPTFIGIVALFMGGGYLFTSVDTVISYFVMSKPEAWYWLILYWLSYAVTFLVISGIMLLSCLLVINVLASPIYDLVSSAVEKDLLGHADSVSLWESFKLMGEELKKVLLVLLLSVITLLLTLWIPLLNIVAVVITALLLGWEFYDFPLVRRGLRLRQRLQLVVQDVWSVGAFGLWLLIPFVQFFMMPLACAGGTIMAIEGLLASGAVTRLPSDGIPPEGSPKSAPSAPGVLPTS